MIGKALKLLVHDRKSFAWHIKIKLLNSWATFVSKSGFHFQGKMDLDPKSWWHNPQFVESVGGFFLPNDKQPRQITRLEPYDFTRRDMIILLLRSLLDRGVDGDLAELGVYKGSTARLIHHYLPERKFYLFDTFSGFDQRDVQLEQSQTGLQTEQQSFSDTNVELVLKNIAPLNKNLQVFPGYFPQSVPEFLKDRRFAFIHIDADLYEPILAGLNFFYERVVPGGVILVHDYNSWPGSRKAVTEFFADKPEIPIPMPDKSGSALVIKLSGKLLSSC